MQTKPIPEKTNNEWILPSWDVLVKQLFARTEKRKEEKKGEGYSTLKHKKKRFRNALRKRFFFTESKPAII